MVLGLNTILWQAGPSRAAQAKPEKSTVKIGYGSESGAFAQIWIAARRSFFSAEGLDAEVLYSRSVTGVQATIAGELDFVGAGCPEFFQAKREGSTCA